MHSAVIMKLWIQYGTPLFAILNIMKCFYWWSQQPLARFVVFKLLIQGLKTKYQIHFLGFLLSQFWKSRQSLVCSLFEKQLNLFFWFLVTGCNESRICQIFFLIQIAGSTQFFWYRSTLDIASDISAPSSFNFNLAFCLLLAWILVRISCDQYKTTVTVCRFSPYIPRLLK